MELPFAALHQMCAPMLDRLDTLSDPQRDATRTAFGLVNGRSPDRLLIGLALLNLLSAVADDGPLLCVVDDAQWLDRASAEALAFVARRLLADPVGLVFATRPPNSDLAEFPELVVEGLRAIDAQTLLSAVLQVPLDERVRGRIIAETHGNPLALVELTRGLTPAELAGGFGTPAITAMSSQIEARFSRRVAQLPEPTRRFLTVAAAEPTGDPVIVWRAATALGAGARDASPAIDAGLLELGARVLFRHPLVRSAAYGSATLADRRAAHRSLADATDPNVDPDRRAWHRALGSDGPDEAVAEALEQSAHRARARGGLAAAAALLERSVVLTVDPARRPERVLAAATAHLDAGSFEIAAGLLAVAETTALDEMGRARVDLLRASHAISHGDVRDAPALFVRAAQRLETIAPDVAATLYLHAILAATFVGSLASDVGLREAALVARAFPLREEPSAGEWLRDGLTRLTLDGPAAGAPALRRALEMAPDDAFAPQARHLFGNLSAAASALWDCEAMRTLAMLHVSATRATGAFNMLPTALNTVAIVNVFEGDLDGAGSAIAEANQIVDATRSNRVPSVGAARAALIGHDGAESAIDDQIATAHATRHGFALASALWARATLYNGRAEYDRAFAAGQEAMRQPPEHSQLWFHELIEAAARCGQRSVAALTLEQLAETAVASGTDWALGIEARSRALLADAALAEEQYRDAIDRLLRTRLRPELARAHLLYGEWLRRENRRVDARAQLRVAYELFTNIGMRAFAERTSHELAATGETVRKRNVDTFDELTPQEANIARLAADGRTNPEIGAQLFISRRTVEWHLRKVFAKLGVASRRELGRALLGATQVELGAR
jgi:DNA-binding CsgD family transcriptional regulator